VGVKKFLGYNYIIMLRTLMIVAFVLSQPIAGTPQNAIGQKDTVSSQGHDQTSNHDNPTAPPTALPNIPTQDTSEKPDPNKSKADAQSSQWSLSDKIAAGATIAGFLQFIALIVTIWTMHRFGRRQMRAYIIPETGSIVNIANPDPVVGPPRETEARIQYPEWGPVARITIKNVGQTPAYDVLHWGSLDFREYPLRSQLPTMTDELYGHRSPVGPGIPITKTLSHRTLTEDEVLSLKNGTSCLYWNGIIVYFDIFKKKHVTRYRLMYGRMGGAVGVNTDLTFAEEGNETDEGKIRRWWRRQTRSQSPEPQSAPRQPLPDAKQSPHAEAQHGPEQAN
jgi:hypothetical protein